MAEQYIPRVRRTNTRGVYTCSSARPGHADYSVDVRHASRPSCTCPAGREAFRCCTTRAWCKHVRACLLVHRTFYAAPAAAAALDEAFGNPRLPAAIVR